MSQSSSKKAGKQLNFPGIEVSESANSKKKRCIAEQVFNLYCQDHMFVAIASLFRGIDSAQSSGMGNKY